MAPVSDLPPSPPPPTSPKPTPFVFVTGLSGAGISTTMNILEDLGYAVFDNFPLELLPALLAQDSLAGRPAAIAIDTRARNFNPVMLKEKITELKDNPRFTVKTLFLTADESVLLKRYTETRRKHPLARDRSVADGIAAEKSLLFPFKREAGYVIDTTDYSIHDLRRVVTGVAGALINSRMNVTVMSFSYRYGLPREADLVFDVRFLRNPNWDPVLRAKTGLERDVQQFVFQDEVYAEVVKGIETLLNLLLPRYQNEGKSYLTIAFGCTGGRHRSVTVSEQIAQFLGRFDVKIQIHHREIKGMETGAGGA